MISKHIKKIGLVLVGVCSLMLAGCGLGSDKLSTGFYKEAAIKPNGEFVIKNRVDESDVKKAVFITMLRWVRTMRQKVKL